MRQLITVVLFLFMSSTSFGAYKRYFQDPKFPNDKLIYKQTFTNPVASSTSYVVVGTAGATSDAAASLTTFTAQPDVPRNLVITPAATTADVGTCTITVTGTDINSDTITEDFAFVANTTLATTGAKAFKTLTNVAWAASCEDSPYTAQWTIGIGEKLGLSKCTANAGDIFFSLIDGAKEATAPTMASNSSVVSSNTADFNGTMDGTADFILYYMNNFGCEN